MKLLSFNCRGLASTHKTLSLRRLVSRLTQDVIFLQETLGTSESVKHLLQSVLPGWDFLVMDVRGRSGGLATSWHSSSCRISSSWGCFLCLGVNLYSQELNSSFCLINVYGPSQDRVGFWDNLFLKPFFSYDQVIVGGDLNFTLDVAEIWGPKAIPILYLIFSNLTLLDWIFSTWTQLS